MPVQPPIILEEEAYGDIVERIVGTADSLDVRLRDSQAVGLQPGRVGNTSADGDAAKIDITAKVQLEDLLFFRAQLNEVYISAHFECVFAANEAHVVREFKAALDAVDRRIGFPAEIAGPGDIDSDQVATGKL